MRPTSRNYIFFMHPFLDFPKQLKLMPCEWFAKLNIFKIFLLIQRWRSYTKILLFYVLNTEISLLSHIVHGYLFSHKFRTHVQSVQGYSKSDQNLVLVSRKILIYGLCDKSVRDLFFILPNSHFSANSFKFILQMLPILVLIETYPPH